MRMVERPLVLVTEINEMIGIDLCEALIEAGYRVAGPVATVADAEACLEREWPDLAVIEPWLRDGSSAGTMDRLRWRGVPVLVHAACEPSRAFDGTFAAAPWLAQPAIPWDVVIVLDDLAIGSV